MEASVSNSVHATNLKRRETPADHTDPHLIAALAQSLRSGGQNTFATGPVTTTPTATGEARQRRDRRAGARTTTATDSSTPCHTAAPAAPARADQTRRVLYPPPKRTRTRQTRPAPFRPGVLPVATTD
jgi:hypothetical protein